MIYGEETKRREELDCLQGGVINVHVCMYVRVRVASWR
jgi:hypothetical protein